MKSINETKKTIVSGLIWRFSERISAQLVTLVVSIVLARLLSPDEYGAIAIVMIFITLANVFVTSGFGNSLIQKKGADNIDFSSVFFFNIIFSFIIYLILYFIAPYISNFYDMNILTPVIRVLALRIIIAGINSVQQAYVSKNMMFKRFFLSTLFGTVLSGIVGISMAYNGYGIWALVAQYLTNTTVDTIVLWFTVKWRPDFIFSYSRMRDMFKYGWKLLCSALLDSGYAQVRSLMIGKLYSPANLAFYDKGQQYPNLIVTNINASIGSVLFPVMANKQDDKKAIKEITRKAIKISSYIMWPMMVGLAIIAKPLISITLTDKWLPCAPFLQIACFNFAFWPIHTANLEAIKAVGRSDIFLKLETIKKVINITILILVMKYGVMAIALSGVIGTIIGSFINAYPNQNLLNYKYTDQIKDILPSIALSLLMAICIYPIGNITMNKMLLMVIQIFLGGVIYLIGSKIFKFEQYEYIVEIIKENIAK